MKKVFYLLGLMFFAFQLSNAQILAWSFSDRDTQGGEGVIMANLKDPGLKPSFLIRGPAMLNTHTFSRTFMSKLDLIESPNNTKQKAFEEGAYIQFKVIPGHGHKVSVSFIAAKIRPGAGGRPYYYRWTYSLDGQTFIELGEEDGQIRYDNNKRDGEEIPIVKLANILDLQNISQRNGAVFRLYVWGALNPENSTFAIGRSEQNKSDSYVLKVFGEVKKY